MYDLREDDGLMGGAFYSKRKETAVGCGKWCIGSAILWLGDWFLLTGLLPGIARGGNIYTQHEDLFSTIYGLVDFVRSLEDTCAAGSRFRDLWVTQLALAALMLPTWDAADHLGSHEISPDRDPRSQTPHYPAQALSRESERRRQGGPPGGRGQPVTHCYTSLRSVSYHYTPSFTMDAL